MSTINPQWNASSCQYSDTWNVRNSTGTRVCGIQGNETSAISPCCNNAPIQFDDCWMYCESSQSMADFAECVSSGDNSTLIFSAPSSNVFCQSGESGYITKTLKTSAGHTQYAAPKMGWLGALFLCLVFFVSPSLASIIPENSLVQRQSSSNNCSFHLGHSYTSLGRSMQVSADYDGTLCHPSSEKWCAVSHPISTGPVNRTINGNSATDPQYDAFFGIVGNATQKEFPAQGTLNMTYEFLVQARSSYFVRFTPIMWCANGTVTNCGGVLGSTNDTQSVEACGPMLTDASPSVIQGSLGYVVVQ